MISEDRQSIIDIIEKIEGSNEIFNNRCNIGVIEILYKNILYYYNFLDISNSGFIYLINIMEDTERILFLNLEGENVYRYNLVYSKSFLLYPDEFSNIGLFKLNDKNLLKL